MPSVPKEALIEKHQPQIPVLPGPIAEQIPLPSDVLQEKTPISKPSRELELSEKNRLAGENSDAAFEADSANPERIDSRSILSGYIKKEYPGAVFGAMLKSNLTLSLTWDELYTIDKTGEVTLSLPENVGEIKRAHVHFISVTMRRYLVEIAPNPENAIQLDVLRSKKDITQLTLRVPNASEAGSVWDEIHNSIIAVDVYLEISKFSAAK